MSIMTWLRQATKGGVTAELLEQPMQFAEDERHFYELNMKEVLDSHVAWIRRFDAVLSGESNEYLDLTVVGSDCDCALGKWLHGPAKRLVGDSPDYEELRKVHADFHTSAAEVAKLAVTGDKKNGATGLRDLRHQSGSLQLALVRLFASTQR